MPDPFAADPAWTMPDPAWSLAEDGVSPAREAGIESRFTVANGFLAMRGARDVGRASSWTSWITTFRPVSWPRCYVAGLFDLPDIEPPVPVAMPAPDWLRLRLTADGVVLRLRPGAGMAFTRTLDLRRGRLLGAWASAAPGLHLRTLRLAARHDPALALQVVQLLPERDMELALEAMLDPAGTGLTLTQLAPGLAVWRAGRTPHALALAVEAGLAVGDTPRPADAATPLGLAWRWTARAGEVATFHRIVGAARTDVGEDPAPAARAALRRAAPGWRAVHDAHDAAWAERWSRSAVEVEGDAAAQQALRFATYHLASAANPADPAVSVGARAMTGDAYLGHVFWDTEIYLLPFYTLTWPEAARALLLYRHRTLPAARARAAVHGYRGAMFAWESADTGAEATPDSIIGAGGVAVPVNTGWQEQHITADIAYAVWNHWLATGDEAFLRDAGLEILIEAARFWASRAEPGADGRRHIKGVIGPDEYHEAVDDNAFTNAMAARTLRSAAEAAALGEARWPDAWPALRDRLALDADEPAAWRDVAGALATGHDPGTGLVEQFRGFFALPRIDLRGLHGPAAGALVRGRQQVTQASKQADVVALIALLPDALDRETARRCFAYYEPLCTHESSLSAALHAVVAARLGETAEALRLFRMAQSLDLDDDVASSAGGVHIAAQGGLWQAAVLGFAGLTWQDGTLRLAPRLPPDWQSMTFALHWRGSRLRVRLDSGSVSLSHEFGTAIALEVDGTTVVLAPGETATLK